MAYSTATLTGKYETFDGQPASGVVEIIPNSRQLVDPEGDVILSGRVKVTLDETGAFSVTLPATDDATVEPATGRQYTVVAKLRHTHLAAVTGVELATGATVDVADLASAPVVDPLVSTAATTAQLDALEASLSPVATSGAYSDLTGAPTIPATAADVGAEPAGTTAALDASLAPVAKSGAYSDLTAKPTIPTTAADVNALPDTTTAADIGAQPAATLDADTAARVNDDASQTRAALSATYAGRSPSRFGSSPVDENITRQPFASQQTIDATAPGSGDKVGHVLGTTFTGDLGSSTGVNPAFGYGLNVFTTTGANAGDAEGGQVCNIIETSVRGPVGTTIAVVQGLVAEAAFYGADTGATVVQMESMRVAAPKRKDGATAGTAENAYGLVIEAVTTAAVGANVAYSLNVEGGNTRLGGRVEVGDQITATTGQLVFRANYAAGNGASFWLDNNAETGRATVQLSGTGATFRVEDVTAGYAERFSVHRDGTVSMWDGSAMKAVAVGAADSGGAGFRALTIPN